MESAEQVTPVTMYLAFFHPVNAQTSRPLLDACLECVKDGATTIYLLLHTPGGDVAEGFLLYNALRALPVELIVHNVGNVDSIGNVLFLAGSKRYASPSATFMFHGVGFDITNPVRLERKNVGEMLEGIKAHEKRMAEAIALHTTFDSATEIDDLFAAASTKDATYAKAHGIVHDIRDVNIPPGVPLLQVANNPQGA